MSFRSRGAAAANSEVYDDLVAGRPQRVGDDHDARRLSIAGHAPQLGSWSFISWLLLILGGLALVGLAGAGLWAILGYRAQYCSVEPCDCRRIRNSNLPYTVDKDGECYVFAHDLVWSQNNTPAITVLSTNNRIYGNRHSLTLAEQQGQGILVVGTLGIFGPDAPKAGGVELMDMMVRGAEMLYPFTAYGIGVETGGTLRLTNVFVHNINVGVQVFNADADVGNLNCTYDLDANAPKRLAAYAEDLLVPGVGGFCLWSEGSTQTTTEGMRVHVSKGVKAPSPAGPLNTYGIFHFHNPLPNMRTSNPGALRVTDFASLADGGIIALRARSLLLNGVDIEMLDDPYVANVGGLAMGCGNNTNGIAERITIDAENAVPAAYPMLVVASGALLVRDFQIAGRADPGVTYVDDYLPPHIVHPGLLTVDLFDNSYNVTGVRFENGRLTALNGRTYAIAIANDALTFPPVSLQDDDGCNRQFAIELHKVQTWGGAAGLVAGTSLGRYLRVTDSTFAGAAYGAYINDYADSILMERCAFVKNCVGLALADDAGEVMVRDSLYSKNSIHRSLGNPLIESGQLDGIETEVECSLPEIYDTCPQLIIGQPDADIAAHIYSSAMSRSDLALRLYHPELFTEAADASVADTTDANSTIASSSSSTTGAISQTTATAA